MNIFCKTCTGLIQNSTKKTYSEFFCVCADKLTNSNLIEALKHSNEWIQKAPHGENCYVSNHYEGDSGNQCYCGKESLENFLLAVLAKAEVTK